MKRIGWAVTLALVLTACGSSSGTSTTTAAVDTSTTTQSETTNTEPTSTPTTEPLIPGADSPVIIGRTGSIDLSGEEVRYEGDADFAVAAAFDDLSGGLVYQYETTPEEYPASSILRLRPGTLEPTIVIYAEPGRWLRLLDVETVEDRTMFLYLEGSDSSDGDTLLLADLEGGAPTIVAQVETASESAGVVPTAIRGGSLAERAVAVIWWYGDLEASCSFAEVYDMADRGEVLFGPVPELCGQGDVSSVALGGDGSRLAYEQEGHVIVTNLDDANPLADWTISAVNRVDFNGTDVLAAAASQYTTLSLSGRSPATHPLPADWSSISQARRPVTISPGTFLGGVRPLPASCSASGMASIIDSQGGLPAPVAATRDAIVAAATGCDAAALAAVAGDQLAFNFGGWPDPVRFWRWSEQEGFGVLARIVDVLGLPFVVQPTASGPIYTWPSAFQESPSDADWAALADVFNEEDIDLFRDFGGYIGMRVGIAEDGTWLFAVEGD